MRVMRRIRFFQDFVLYVAMFQIQKYRVINFLE